VNCDIDDDIIELHAMGRLKDAALREHLDTCESCKARVENYREWIELLKQALQEFEDRGEE
jgi:anti-sigma factor RsiW